MARRKAAPKRDILPDPLFHSELLAKFINHYANHIGRLMNHFNDKLKRLEEYTENGFDPGI